ncbi:MAG: SpoIIE family protein phosphatase, partial [Candidatus Eremiobacteraeota bacterium]|nr:SpoIIE family protein phosphatase [Candidatus Eremiobacteraeota bacterium]
SMPSPSSQRSFEKFASELLEIFEHLPVPMAIALDTHCEDVRVNAAFRRILKLEKARGFRAMQTAATTGNDVRDSVIDVESTDGTFLHIACSAWPLLDEANAVRGSVGVFADVSERSEIERSARIARDALRAAEARYRLIAEAMPQFVWVDAPDGSAVYANQRWLRYIGMTAEENAGFGWTAIVHPDDAIRLDPIRARTLRSGEDFEGECRYKGRDGKYRWFLFRSIGVRDETGTITSWVGTATDIDRQKRAEEQQTFFATASEVLGSTLDEKTALQRIADLCVPAIAEWCMIDLIDSDQKAITTAIVKHTNQAKGAKLQRLLGPTHVQTESEFGAPHCVRYGARIFPYIEEWMVDDAFGDPADRKLFADAGYSSAIVVPLKSGDAVYGALTLISADPARLYTDFDLMTATEFARRGAIAIEHSRLFEREHLVATTLQRALLPPMLPDIGTVRFHSAYAAAVKGEEVGGDWYDAFPLPDGRIALSIGDVAGHGLDAAVTMGTVRQAIRTAALERAMPNDVLQRANAALALDLGDKMVTAIFAAYEPESGDFEYAIAGHPRPVVAQLNGNVYVLDGNGPPLGPLFDMQYVDMMRTKLPSGASVIFYTDGLIEFDRNIDRAEERLFTLLGRRGHVLAENPAAEIIHRVLYAPQRDDIAVLVMSLAQSPEGVDIVLPADPRAASIARTILRDFSHFHKLAEEQAFALICVCGEAIANAIEHPYSDASGTFRLRVARVETSISVEVSDNGTWRNTVSVDRGRGFTIMRAMAKSFDLRRAPGGTSVHLTL